MLLKGIGKGLAKTREALRGRLGALFSRGKDSPETMEGLEEMLIEADIGVETTMEIMERLERALKGHENTMEVARGIIRDAFLDALKPLEAPLSIDSRPYCIMVVGVNGVGKTTLIGKLAHRFRKEGLKVVIGASDTFRAAAIEQLEEWGKRTGSEVVKHEEGSDPGAVAFDTVKAAQARGADIAIIDTGGRLHTKVNLMEELKKVKRVMGKALSGAPHEILLVIDATTGQNALQQALTFHRELGITGMAITKLDGTAKGGILVAIGKEVGIPIRYIGVGEGVDDLMDFRAEEFVEALLS